MPEDTIAEVLLQLPVLLLINLRFMDMYWRNHLIVMYVRVQLQMAVVDSINLESVDPLLTEDDVEGALFPIEDWQTLPNSVLRRWLQCRVGASTAGSKRELIERYASSDEN